MTLLESILNSPGLIKVIGGGLVALGSYLILQKVKEADDRDFKNRIRRTYSGSKDED